MNRREALRRVFGGAVAVAVAPVDALRRIAALEPQNYIGDARSLTTLIHEVFVESVVNHVRRESAVAALFKDAFPDDYAAHGERMVFRMGPDLC